MKVAWAINPFDTNSTVYKQGQAIVKSLQPKYVEIIFIASPSVLDLSLAFDVPEKDRYSKYAQRSLEETVHSKKLQAKKCTVLHVDSASTTAQVKVLSQYLHRNKFDVVVMPTHARAGVDRFFQGSFAETMILNSKVDVLAFNPKMTAPKKMGRVMFAHDGTKAATKDLAHVRPHFSQLKSKIDVLYVAPAVASSFDGTTILFAENYRNLLDRSIDSIEKQLNKLDEDIRFIPIVSNDTISSVICSEGKKQKANLIFVSAKISGFIAGLGGSISRQVIRQSTLPVWVIKS